MRIRAGLGIAHLIGAYVVGVHISCDLPSICQKVSKMLQTDGLLPPFPAMRNSL
jgi:hypothetical protein